MMQRTPLRAQALNTYVAELSAGVTSGSPKNVLLFLADVWGPLFLNNKLFPDYLA